MADLSPQGFVAVTSASGSLACAWDPAAAAGIGELHAWVLLGDPERLDPAALHPERLLAELIRVPVDPTLGRALLFVPVGRPLGVLLMARDLAGHVIAPPAFTVASGPPLPRPAPTPTLRPPPPSTPTPTLKPTPPPAPWDHLADSRRIPLVFARPGSGTAAFGAYAGSLGPDPASAGPPAFAALRDRVAALTAIAPRTPTPAPDRPDTPTPLTAGFGVRQRWTLTRLSFPPPTAPGRERRLVLSTTFIGQTDLAAWRRAPPADALAVPEACDGLVDGLSAEDQVVFYALLEASPEGWLPRPLTPSSPPFLVPVTPLLLGDPRQRLLAHPRPVDSAAFDELLEQALVSLERGQLPHTAPPA